MEKVKLGTGSYNRLSSYETEALQGQGRLSVKYHSTEIVYRFGNKVVLNSNGYQTVTTKRKMNQASRQFGLGFSVNQINWEWWVTYKYHGINIVEKYFDGMVIYPADIKD